jgi:hypothetical protein
MTFEPMRSRPVRGLRKGNLAIVTAHGLLLGLAQVVKTRSSSKIRFSTSEFDG